MPYTKLKGADASICTPMGSIQSRHRNPTPKPDHLLSISLAARELCSAHDPWIFQMASVACGMAAWEFLSDSSTLPWTQVDSQQHAEQTKTLEEQHLA